jgi:hypothetical protein
MIVIDKNIPRLKPKKESKREVLTSYIVLPHYGNKKGPLNTGLLICCVALLRQCRKKEFEKNPLLPSGQSLLVSESPIK